MIETMHVTSQRMMCIFIIKNDFFKKLLIIGRPLGGSGFDNFEIFF
jgi:hypothetical protein